MQNVFFVFITTRRTRSALCFSSFCLRLFRFFPRSVFVFLIFEYIRGSIRGGSATTNSFSRPSSLPEPAFMFVMFMFTALFALRDSRFWADSLTFYSFILWRRSTRMHNVNVLWRHVLRAGRAWLRVRCVHANRRLGGMRAVRWHVLHVLDGRCTFRKLIVWKGNLWCVIILLHQILVHLFNCSDINFRLVDDFFLWLLFIWQYLETKITE